MNERLFIASGDRVKGGETGGEMAAAFSGPGECSSSRCAGEEMTTLRHDDVSVNNHLIHPTGHVSTIS